MLSNLHIENIAVIKRADCDFSAGLTVLTGETGAGKSILIDSLNLLLGGRTPRDLLRTGESSAFVSALFERLPPNVCEQLARLGVEAGDGSLLVSRTLGDDGRTSVKLNGRPVTVGILREIAGLLVNIHGQHDSQALLQPERHVELLDDFCAEPELPAKYGERYAEWKRLESSLRALRESNLEARRSRELYEFQRAELEGAKLRSGEVEALEAKKIKLANADKIKRHSDAARSGASGAAELTHKASAALRALQQYIPQAGELAARVDDCGYELEDVAQQVRLYGSEEDGDPTAALDKIETRLDFVSRLCKKYGGDAEYLIKYRDSLSERLGRLEHSNDDEAELTRDCGVAREEVTRRAAELTELRKKGARALEKSVMESLKALDMEKVRFKVGFSAKELGPDGADQVEFLVATNPGEEPRPLQKIASGGELSRFMLAVRSVLAGRDGVGTLIFDEIDAGISGGTSQRIGIMLRDTAAHGGCQVICITHSAQIAAMADRHYRITKETDADGRASTSVEALDRDARAAELERIIGGIETTEGVRGAARDLLAQAEKIKGEGK